MKLAGLALLLTAACHSASPPAPARPRSIVLLIGDGMGAAHFTRARMLRGEQFQIGRMRTIGLVGTSAAGGDVTDSSAAATAYATGVKTANGYVAESPDGASHRTVLEAAEERGWATGLVTTAPFGDATPAAFAAHHKDRKDRPVVCLQVCLRGADLLISSGLDGLGVNGVPSLDELARAGAYRPVTTLSELRAAPEGPTMAVFPSGATDTDSPGARLPELAAVALERLSRDPDGFFLLLEHEGTDSASHTHSVEALDASLRSFDETVGVVLDFAAKHPDVLVLVAGDHETGGLSLLPGGGVGWATELHTNAAVPIFAAGPGAEAFVGWIENDAVGRALLGFVDGR